MPRPAVVALVAAYNEADVIGAVVGDLIAQGAQVYLLDDGSTDGTAAAVEPYRGRGVLEIERLAGGGADGPFDWERILRRKAELAQQLDADWFIHHDADEFRESPWAGVTLQEGIARVDALGYNAIDFELLNFWPTHDDFRPGTDPREAFRLYQHGGEFDRLQIRCWKKTDARVDLASSGGHDVAFPGRRVFPLRFLLRHYPIRGQAHGERKVFHDRRGRFVPAERARGWHVQYDAVREGASFLRDASTLTPYDGDAVRVLLMLHHRGLEELEAALTEARGAVERLEGRARALADEVGRLGGELQSRTDQLAVERAAVDAHRAEGEKLRAALEARGVEIADVQRELDLRAAELTRLRAGFEDRARRLDAVYQSLSWRWTAPARALGRLLGGGGAK
jgi:hypothetical protein